MDSVNKYGFVRHPLLAKYYALGKPIGPILILMYGVNMANNHTAKIDTNKVKRRTIQYTNFQ